MTFFVLAMLPLLIALGAWQLDRAALKKGYEADYFDRMAETPLPIARADLDQAFARVAIQGWFDPDRYFLVDNQIHQGRPGYWVVGLFKTAAGQGWLVNRGWVAAPRLRETLPDVLVPAGRMALVGILWPDTGLVPLLAEDPWSAQWPKRVQRLDIERMAAYFDGVAPVEVRLEPGQPGVAVPATLGHDFKASMHEGYAAQWFGLALVLTVGYLIFGYKRHD
jgi:surfeit locus 1 family protein